MFETAPGYKKKTHFDKEILLVSLDAGFMNINDLWNVEEKRPGGAEEDEKLFIFMWRQKKENKCTRIFRKEIDLKCVQTDFWNIGTK